MRALGFPSTVLQLRHWFFSISSVTGRKQAETIGALVELDTTGIQRLYFQLLTRKTSQLFFFLFFFQHAHWGFVNKGGKAKHGTQGIDLENKK